MTLRHLIEIIPKSRTPLLGDMALKWSCRDISQSEYIAT